MNASSKRTLLLLSALLLIAAVPAYSLPLCSQCSCNDACEQLCWTPASTRSWCINYLCSDFCYFKAPASTETTDPQLAAIFADAKLSQASEAAEALLPEPSPTEDVELEPTR